MIPLFSLSAWRQQVPWIEDHQVEQDLLISRVLVDLYQNSVLKEKLIFRGGTALNKLYIQPPARYSEDIDFVQLKAEPIGGILDQIRHSLIWLGEPKRKLTERSAKLIYRYLDIHDQNRKLKIEINILEHFHVLDLIEHPFLVENSWFSDEANILTYQINELMATKLRALYQRRKGRDLFDLWWVLQHDLIQPKIVTETFFVYCDKEKNKITQTDFQKNLLLKLQHPDFKNDMKPLLAADVQWSMEDAMEYVYEKLIKLL